MERGGVSVGVGVGVEVGVKVTVGVGVSVTAKVGVEVTVSPGVPDISFIFPGSFVQAVAKLQQRASRTAAVNIFFIFIPFFSLPRISARAVCNLRPHL